MDWKLLAWTFSTIFLAEIGDKTQLAVLGMAASGSSRLAVFLAAAAALVSSTALAVFAGEALARWVSPSLLRRGAGALFVVLGIALLIGAADE